MESSNWPIYFKDRLFVSNTESNIAIVTLWTPKEVIQKLVNVDKVSIIGQLYTKKGINYLVRNILANPFIDKIYLVGSDLMESGDALLKLISVGVDDQHKIIGDTTAELEKEISIEAINAFRQNIKIIDMRGGENLAKIASAIESEVVKPFKLWRQPEMFAETPKPQITAYPSEIDLIKIRRPTIAEAYPAVLKHVLMFGLESEPVINYISDTSKKMKEILNLSVVITDENPDDWKIPSYMPFSNVDLENYFKGFFDHDKHTEDYTYGERLFNYSADEMKGLKEVYPWLKIDRFQKFFPQGGIDQVAVSIVRKLKNFKYDKGAIALLGNPYTDVFPQRPSKKIPCLFLIQCQIYQNKLNMTAYFRSNDMYNAWPLNAFALRKVQSSIAKQLKSDLGALITISNMAHIYEHNYADAEKISKENYKGNCEWDPRGNLIVAVENKEIVVRLISPDGNLDLAEWRADGTQPKAARDLSFKLDADLAVSTLGNAFYIGRQLERAETAIKLGLEFTQDVSLEFSKSIS